MAVNRKCHDCGVEEGQIHHDGCDNERCPFCGMQLISCDCDSELSGGDEVKWQAILAAKGRVPHIHWPLFCIRCGIEYNAISEPHDYLLAMINVPPEWMNHVGIRNRFGVFCHKCFGEMVALLAPHIGPHFTALVLARHEQGRVKNR